MRKITLALAVAALSNAGCATKDYVHQYVDGRVDKVDTNLRLLEFRTSQVSYTAQEALERAVAAGKLAQGKLVYEVVLTDDKLHFEFDSAVLSDSAKKMLDVFADRLKTENRNIYIEIQGHTDAKGPDDYNLRLSDARAESVRRYLNMKAGIPLHRLATIGYGEGAPLADNDTHDGRSKNRRVVLVVLS
ncbi:MAG: OmpA family protein [Thiobacillus sp.]|nr:OmpA family protein [Thiobacillus sp.]